MVEINQSERIVRAKIVYYGPAAGGKTTNLLELARRADADRRGQMISVNTTQERTLLLDLVAVDMPAFHNFEMRFQIIAVPGQKMYAASRRFLLTGADAVVFVANSADDRWEETLESMKEMNEFLVAQKIDPTSVPVVFQYNKQDLPEVTPFEAMDRTLNARRSDSIPAVASSGDGVMETFSAALKRTVDDLCARFDLGKGIDGGPSIEEWTRKTMQMVFGWPESEAPSEMEPEDTAEAAEEESELEATAPMEEARKEEAVESEPAPTYVGEEEGVTQALMDAPPRELGRLALNVRGAGPTAESRVSSATSSPTPEEAAESLVASYVEAAAELSDALEEQRQKHDATKRRLAELSAAIDAAQALLRGDPAEDVLQMVLERIGRGLGSEVGSLSLVRPDGTLSMVVSKNLETDPIFDIEDENGKPMPDALMAETEPVIFKRGDPGPLNAALEKVGNEYASLAAIPIRTHARALGLVCFYLPQEFAAPSPESMPHLSRLGQGLSLALEIASVNIASERLQNVEKAALVGHLAGQAMREIGEPIDNLMKSVGNTLLQAPKGMIDTSHLLRELFSIGDDLVRAQVLREGFLHFLSGRLPDQGEISLENLFKRIKGDYEEPLRRTGIELIVNRHPEATKLFADDFLLRSTLLALIENSRSYLAGYDGGVIGVAAEPLDGDRVRIGVSDNTGALRKGESASIPDYLAWSLDRRVRGFGLTLAQKVVEHFNGEWHMSEDGERGNEISLTFPTSNGRVSKPDNLEEEPTES